MKPLLIHGSSDKARFDYACSVGNENNWMAVMVEPKNALNDIYKSSVTQTLSEQIKLFIIEDAEKIPPKDAETLAPLMLKSHHRFILSTKNFYKTPQSLKSISILKPLGPNTEGLFETISYIQKETNRDNVRSFLENSPIEIGQILHMLKGSAWKASAKLSKGIELCLRNLYKYRPDYMLSMVAYLFPPETLSVSSNKDSEPMKLAYEDYQKKILLAYPKLKKSQIRNIFILMPTAKWGKEVEVQPKSKPKEETKSGLDRWI